MSLLSPSLIELTVNLKFEKCNFQWSFGITFLFVIHKFKFNLALKFIFKPLKYHIFISSIALFWVVDWVSSSFVCNTLFDGKLESLTISHLCFVTCSLYWGGGWVSFSSICNTTIDGHLFFFKLEWLTSHLCFFHCSLDWDICKISSSSTRGSSGVDNCLDFFFGARWVASNIFYLSLFNLPPPLHSPRNLPTTLCTPLPLSLKIPFFYFLFFLFFSTITFTPISLLSELEVRMRNWVQDTSFSICIVWKKIDYRFTY